MFECFCVDLRYVVGDCASRMLYCKGLNVGIAFCSVDINCLPVSFMNR